MTRAIIRYRNKVVIKTRIIMCYVFINKSRSQFWKKLKSRACLYNDNNIIIKG